VNSAQHRNGGTSAGPVVTVRRAISMLGMETLRRSALALRPWPGAAPAAHVPELESMLKRVMRAGRLAVALAPAGYDAEVVYVLTLMQNMGRLIVQYHCADEAAQIRRLMQPTPAEEPGTAPTPGMSEEAAAFSVLGVDIESIGTAIAKRWGVDDQIATLLRRWPLQQPVRAGESDQDILRSVASCANEVMDLAALPAREQGPALVRVASRYARVLQLSVKELQLAVQESATTKISEVLAAANGNAFFATGMMDL
jgi:eukaryotic-like serine/threonine-protein kinase